MDPIESPIPVRPGAHYAMGGVKTNTWGETSVPGLYAAGECACVSIHGANRLGGNSLLETIVFGRRAGVRASEYARSAPIGKNDAGLLEQEQTRICRLLNNDEDERPWQVREDLGRILALRFGLVRTRNSMAEAVASMKELRVRAMSIRLEDQGAMFNTDLITALELGSLVELAETVMVGALAREESRGAHYRSDFPQRDDAQWLKHTICRYSEQGPKLEYGPVTITRFPPS